MSQSLRPEVHNGDSLEGRQDVRIVASLPGRYSLPNRRAVQGNPREFACRAVNVSTREAALYAPVNGKIGERIIAHFHALGRLEGSILRNLYGGFTMTLEGSDDYAAKLAAKLIWLEKQKNDDVPDNRQHKRIIPRKPHSTLVLADGSTVGCFVIDISGSGAAVSADINFEIGMPLAVGKVVGRVVRRLPEGFAVRFVDLQDPCTVEQLVIKPDLRQIRRLISF